MVTFEEIAKKPEFRNLYTTAIEQAGIWGRIEALDQEGSLDKALKVLDLGGGTGTLGIMLAEEYGPFVEYVNVDTDERALQLSVGRTVHGSYTNLPDLLEGEKFDYVFALNVDAPSSEISLHTYKEMQRDGQDMFFVSSIQDADYNRKGLYERLVLLNAALSVTDKGKLIRGGPISKDVLGGIEKVLRDNGLQLLDSTGIDVDMELARQLARFDVERSGESLSPSAFERIALTYSQNFRIAIFDHVRTVKDTTIIQRINQNLEQYSQLSSYLSAQAQFWD